MNTITYPDRTIIDSAYQLIDGYDALADDPHNPNISEQLTCKFGKRTLEMRASRATLQYFEDAHVQESWEGYYINNLPPTVQFYIHNCGLDEYSLFESTIRKAGLNAEVIGTNIDSFYDSIQARAYTGKRDVTGILPRIQIPQYSSGSQHVEVKQINFLSLISSPPKPFFLPPLSQIFPRVPFMWDSDSLSPNLEALCLATERYFREHRAPRQLPAQDREGMH